LGIIVRRTHFQLANQMSLRESVVGTVW